MAADILPTNTWIFNSAPLSSEKDSISCPSLQKARITLAPSRFSLVLPSTLSKAACTFL